MGREKGVLEMIIDDDYFVFWFILVAAPVGWLAATLPGTLSLCLATRKPRTPQVSVNPLGLSLRR